jgi:hypothetical protein
MRTGGRQREDRWTGEQEDNCSSLVGGEMGGDDSTWTGSLSESPMSHLCMLLSVPDGDAELGLHQLPSLQT